MEKTIEEWFQDLPEDIQKRAIRNTVNRNGICRLKEKTTSLKNAINEAFSWISSPEGGVFWGELYGALSEGKDISTLKIGEMKFKVGDLVYIENAGGEDEGVIYGTFGIVIDVKKNQRQAYEVITEVDEDSWWYRESELADPKDCYGKNFLIKFAEYCKKNHYNNFEFAYEMFINEYQAELRKKYVN